MIIILNKDSSLLKISACLCLIDLSITFIVCTRKKAFQGSRASRFRCAPSVLVGERPPCTHEFLSTFIGGPNPFWRHEYGVIAQPYKNP